MTPEPKLLPCPFCGAPQEDVDGEIGTRHKEWCYFIVWEHELPGAPNRIMAWNTRTETQRLEERVEQLQQESNHNKRMWEGQINRTKLAKNQLAKAHAAIAVKDEALKAGKKQLLERIGLDRDSDCQVVAVLNNALTSTPQAAKEMVEQNERMRKALEKFKLELTPHSFCSRIEYEQVHHALDEALNPTTGQKEKE